RTGYAIGYASLGREILAEQQGIPALYGIMFPDKVSYDLGHIFVGPLLASLAITGAMSGRRDPIVAGWTIVVLLTIFLIFLDAVRIALFWSFVPGLSHTRHLSLLCTPFVLGIVILACTGLRSLLRDSGRAARLVFIVALALMAGVGAVAAAIGGDSKAVVNSI